MYRLNESIHVIKGVGPALARDLEAKEIRQISDLLLKLPFRYEDRSQIVTIDQLTVNQLITFKAHVMSCSTSYRGRRIMTRATLQDSTGRIQAIWFNNRFLKNQLKKGSEWFFSGKISERKILVQATIEAVKTDTVHTGRLVPLYSSLGNKLKLGTFRRIIKEITDRLADTTDGLDTIQHQFPKLSQALRIVHFPEPNDDVPLARERLALEELIALIKHSQQVKQDWKNKHSAFAIQLPTTSYQQWLTKKLPFELTTAQQQAVNELLNDLQANTPMNRLLIGDVGSGKTVVVGIAAFATVKLNQHNAVLVAPTQILAQQHLQSLTKLFPDLNIELVTTKEAKKFKPNSKPTLYVGTHAVINKLTEINPVLVAYDEQHRFGVKQRTTLPLKHGTPHTLTLSATPIPRSLMLTLFSHLSLSTIDQMPQGRIPSKTWLVSNTKKQDSLNWIAETINKTTGQALIVCPFIEPSSSETLAGVTAAKELFTNIKNFYQQTAPKLKVGLLHGKLSSQVKQQVIDDLFQQKIDILITTPVVEVGVDLPKANIIVVEAAERFGLASLHQLRGRVGRAGQESYCLLFTNSNSAATKKRLTIFTKENNGLKLAEQDLQNRGAGDLFGFQQHGFGNLQFASWTNLELIQTAHQLYKKVASINDWQPLISFKNDNFPTNN
ncbi:MAG: ATP-dependent DNA helicase RecG [Patescibacteria group bacterium]